MSKLEAALAHAREGFSIFPLSPGTKIPPKGFDGWAYRATTDETRIREWWANQPDANIAAYAGSLLVVDVDPRKGGDKTFCELQRAQEFPKTRRSKTRMDGDHIIYALPPHTALQGKNDLLGPGVDVKSYGGYIVMPGSVVEGKTYRWANDRPIAEAPQWLLDACKRARPKAANAGKRLADEDEDAVVRAQAWLLTVPDAHEGERDNATFAVSAKLYDFGLTFETVHYLLTLYAEMHTFPQISESDVHRLAISGGKNRQSPIGILHPDAAKFDAVDTLSKEHAAREREKAKHPTQGGLFFLTFGQGADLALTHNADPLVEGWIDCAAMSVVYGESNSGKSFQEMDKDFHIAAGLPWNGCAVKQGAVVWVAAEGGAGVYKRLAALKKHYGRNVPLYIVPCPVNLLRADADVKPLIDLVKQIETEYGQKVVKVTLDTLSRVIAGGDENSSVDMGRLVHHFDAIRDAVKAHVAVIHHTGKDKAKGARGHSLLRAATDTEIEIGNRQITVTKQRDLESHGAVHFRLVPIDVGADTKGRRITSCIVEFGQVEDTVMPLTPTQRRVMMMVATDPQNTTNSTFGTEEILSGMSECRKNGSDKLPTRQTVTGLLSDLSEARWLKKVGRNQYVRTCRKLSEIVGNEQVVMSEFFGYLTSRKIPTSLHPTLAEQEGWL